MKKEIKTKKCYYCEKRKKKINMYNISSSELKFYGYGYEAWICDECNFKLDIV